MKDAERRWEIIDVDADSPEKKNDSRNNTKRRKVTLSPESGNASGAEAAEDSILDEMYEGWITDHSLKNDTEVVVSGCGSEDANGTYKRVPRYDYFFGGYCEPLMKEGRWKLDGTYTGTFVLVKAADNIWYITLWRGIKGSETKYYGSIRRNKSNAELPPETGWETMGDGCNPPPKLSMTM